MKNKNKVGLFSGIQAKIMLLLIATMLVSAGITTITAISRFTNVLTERVISEMGSLANAYGAELQVAVEANGGEMLDTQTMTDMLGSVVIEGVEGSYCYVVDAAGIMLMHPTPSKVGNPVENEVVAGLVQQLKKGIIPQPDVVEYEFKGAIKMAGYYVLKDGSAILVVTADRSAALASISSFVVQCVISIIVVLAVVVVGGILISRSIAKPILQLTDIVNRSADFDFTESEVHTRLTKGKDETAIMARALETLRVNLVGT